MPLKTGMPMQKMFAASLLVCVCLRGVGVTTLTETDGYSIKTMLSLKRAASSSSGPSASAPAAPASAPADSPDPAGSPDPAESASAPADSPDPAGSPDPAESAVSSPDSLSKSEESKGTGADVDAVKDAEFFRFCEDFRAEMIRSPGGSRAIDCNNVQKVDYILETVFHCNRIIFGTAADSPHMICQRIESLKANAVKMTKVVTWSLELENSLWQEKPRSKMAFMQPKKMILDYSIQLLFNERIEEFNREKHGDYNISSVLNTLYEAGITLNLLQRKPKLEPSKTSVGATSGSGAFMIVNPWQRDPLTLTQTRRR